MYRTAVNGKQRGLSIQHPVGKQAADRSLEFRLSFSPSNHGRVASSLPHFPVSPTTVASDVSVGPAGHGLYTPF
jgi:hypothetical protein